MKNNLIKKPKIYVFVTMLWIVMWTFISILGIYQMFIDQYFIILPFFLLLIISIINALLILLYVINFKIEIGINEIKIKSWLGKPKIYNINDLYITIKREYIFIFHNNKKIAKITFFDNNYDAIFVIKDKS